jgi:hypothetical protein
MVLFFKNVDKMPLLQLLNSSEIKKWYYNSNGATTCFTMPKFQCLYIVCMNHIRSACLSKNNNLDSQCHD